MPPAEQLGFSRGGMVISGRTVPLYAGSVHYWRLERESWRDALAATKSLGVHFIDTYVPWSVHEIEPGQADFGGIDPRRDVSAFLALVHELGLYAIVRPGPHVNAELTFFGIPARVVWDPACQARSPRGNPVVLPMVPLGFPVPSYASEVFLAETEKWYQLVAPQLAPHVHPRGPIVLCQIDNEAAFYFRDGAYDQDYRPEAVLLYREFLEKRYESAAALARAYGKRAASFAEMQPPTIFDAASADDLSYHLDWAEFQEHLLATSLGRMKAALERAGLSGVPTFHNMTMGYEATPLSASRLARSVDLVGLDYYHRASAVERQHIARRTTELVTRCDALGHPPFGCEMAAGFPPYFFPFPDEEDNRFTVLAALAYGLRGFNIYMAVERDRWIGAPIDQRGRPRAFAEFWRDLLSALERVRFHELVRRAPVHLVMPALKRRLNRSLHAFSPATPALFALLGAGSRESCFEEDFGLGGAVASQMDAFIAAFEEALALYGVPFAHVDGDGGAIGLGEARWIVCPTAGGVDTELWAALTRAVARGARVTVGPEVPTRGSALAALGAPLDAGGFELLGGQAAYPYFDRDRVGELVTAAVRELGLPTLAVSPATLHATVHEDAAGRPRVLFLMNPGEGAERATVSLGTDAPLFDLLEGTRHDAPAGRIELSIEGRSVRILEIGSAA